MKKLQFGRALAIVAAILASCTNAASADDIAARAVAEAKSMPAGQPKDITLREVSRNLRHVDRRRAMDAARAMSDASEFKSFSPGPDELTQHVVKWYREQADSSAQCEKFIVSLKPGSDVSADEEQRIRNCFFMDAPPGIDPPPLPPFYLIITASEALPAGRTKASLLYMATWDSVPRRPPGAARDAVRRLRALLPKLPPEFRAEAAEWLQSTAVDQIEGKPDEAIARVRRAFQQPATSDTLLAAQAATQANGLIADFLAAGDIARAVEVTALLPSSQDCWMVDDGFTGVATFVLSHQTNELLVATYLDRLQATGVWARLCPRGLHAEHAANVWLKAGREAKALEVAASSGIPALLARTRATVAERKLDRGDIAGAKEIILKAVGALPRLDQGNEFERNAAAASRLRLIHRLVQVGERDLAERLAATFPGPGWRGFAYSVIVATAGRDRAGADWAGPFLDLQDVPAGS